MICSCGRLSWFLDCQKKVDLVLQASQLVRQIEIDFLDNSFKDVEGYFSVSFDISSHI